jgi:hypothetical protein
VGKKITVGVGIITETVENTSTYVILPAITDEEGIASFSFPSGTGKYQFSWEGGKYVSELTLQSGETVAVPYRMQ